MYVTVDFIRNGLVKLWDTREKRELQNENSCPQLDSNPLPLAY